jgi:hypothetical protein
VCSESVVDHPSVLIATHVAASLPIYTQNGERALVFIGRIFAAAPSGETLDDPRVLVLEHKDGGWKVTAEHVFRVD